VLLLDAFMLVLVLYRAGAGAHVPFPPPEHSKLWRLVADVQRVRVQHTPWCDAARLCDAACCWCVTPVGLHRTHMLLPAACPRAQERRVTTHVEVVREGAEGSELFYSLLIDDPDDVECGNSSSTAGTGAGLGGPGGASGPQQQQQQRLSGPAPTGVEQFLRQVKAEVMMQLQASK
jgi:hypothetical protein